MYIGIDCQQIAHEVAIIIYSCKPLSNLLAVNTNELCMNILHLPITRRELWNIKYTAITAKVSHKKK